MWNAFTHLDWTTFFETVPAEKVDLAIALDRALRVIGSTGAWVAVEGAIQGMLGGLVGPRGEKQLARSFPDHEFQGFFDASTQH